LDLVAIATGDGQVGLRLVQVLVEAAQPVGGVVRGVAGQELRLAVRAA
jgi:hypothetical protein